MGLATRLPPQFRHLPARIPSAQLAQNVHSNEQILACGESGGRSPLQHSQQGLISSIRLSKICTVKSAVSHRGGQSYSGNLRPPTAERERNWVTVLYSGA